MSVLAAILMVSTLAGADANKRSWWPQKPLWTLSLANISSSWTVVDGVVFTKEISASGEAVVARDAQTGDMLWQWGGS